MNKPTTIHCPQLSSVGDLFLCSSTLGCSLHIWLHFYSCVNNPPKRLIQGIWSCYTLHNFNSFLGPYFKPWWSYNSYVLQDFNQAKHKWFHILLCAWHGIWLPWNIRTFMVFSHLNMKNEPSEAVFFYQNNIRALFTCSAFKWMLLKIVLLETSVG